MSGIQLQGGESRSQPMMEGPGMCSDLPSVVLRFSGQTRHVIGVIESSVPGPRRTPRCPVSPHTPCTQHPSNVIFIVILWYACAETCDPCDLNTKPSTCIAWATLSTRPITYHVEELRPFDPVCRVRNNNIIFGRALLLWGGYKFAPLQVVPR